ncbi:SPFH domain-containing protein [Virgisporangium aliadipatigenens]
MKSVRVVPQQSKYVIERLGKYHRTLNAGLNMLVPYIDAVRKPVDMREQVKSFPPQPVITSDNLSVNIDTVLYFRVIDPVKSTYEIADFLQAIEQLTVTTLRNIIGSLDLERALTSRDDINRHLSGVLDETTGRWGIKVTRVEIKAIEPPNSIRDSMEKQMRAERDRRAAILNAEGTKQAQILTAQGDQQAAVLRAEGNRQARILEAEGQAKAIRTLVDAIHAADPDPQVMAYQYMHLLPQIANGQASKLWILPAEVTRALEGIGGALSGAFDGPARRPARAASADADADPAPKVTEAPAVGAASAAVEAEAREVAAAATRAAEEATAEARKATVVGGAPALPSTPDGGTLEDLLGNGSERAAVARPDSA